MTRLIDADALMVCRRTVQTVREGTLKDEIAVLWDDVKEQPTVDAVPVRHGKWIEHKGYPGIAYLCSECGFFTTMPTYHYCPNCGAKMDGAERKEE